MLHIHKLKCLNGVPEVIKNCKVISQTRQYAKKVKGKKKFAVSYELAYYTTLGEEIRVIVERIGTGKHQFLSVMPHRKRKGKIKAPN